MSRSAAALAVGIDPTAGVRSRRAALRVEDDGIGGRGAVEAREISPNLGQPLQGQAPRRILSTSGAGEKRAGLGGTGECQRGSEGDGGKPGEDLLAHLRSPGPQTAAMESGVLSALASRLLQGPCLAVRSCGSGVGMSQPAFELETEDARHRLELERLPEIAVGAQSPAFLG